MVSKLTDANSGPFVLLAVEHFRVIIVLMYRDATVHITAVDDTISYCFETHFPHEMQVFVHFGTTELQPNN